MTKKEILAALKDLDDYFRIHSWCTQMDEKISEFISALDDRSYAYVREWAVSTLGKENLKSNSQILAIIFLKLSGVSDKELVRLLYTVLSDRLTYEDFKSLNGYIFKGKPPLSPDLFYNITERVFIDKKSALQKALSISSIISEADPQLTIFYMTMLLCRVDLNSENKAMLNLLLYCVDADIPEEMAEGIRDNLSGLSDVLNELLNDNSDINSGNKEVLEKVFHHLTEKKTNPAIITIEKKGTVQEQEPVPNPVDYENTNVSSSGDVSTGTPEDRRRKKEVDSDTGSFGGSAGLFTGYGGIKKSGGESRPLKSEEPKLFAGNNMSTENDRDGFRKKKSFRKQEQGESGGNKDKTGLEQDARFQDSYGSPEAVDSAEPDKGIISGDSILTYSRKKKELKDEESPAPKKYRIGLRKFSISDLQGLIGRKNGRKTVNTENTVGRESRLPIKTGRKNNHRSFVPVYVAVGIVIISGFFLFSIINTDRKAVTAADTPNTVIKVETGASSRTDSLREEKSESKSAAAEDKDNPLQIAPLLFDIKETPKGVEWTVNKGESVWKLYMYLHENADTLPGNLAELGRMDWLPFIHQIIRLNPWKSFAQPIEPGEKFIIR